MRTRTILMALVCLGLMVEIGLAQKARPARWVKYYDSQYGLSFLYPASIFEPLEPSGFDMLDADEGEGQGVQLISRDGEARIWAWGALNSKNLSLKEYKHLIRDKAKRIGTVTYQPNGDNWFALSGYKGDLIFYRKVIMSCHGYVINSLHIEFPKNRRRLYEPIVEHMENYFRTGRGYYTPVDC